MTPDSLRAFLLVPTLMMATVLGGVGSTPWPICGLWAAAGYARRGQFSIGAALALCLIGLVQDLMHEAPLGTWPLAFFAAYLIATGYAATLAYLFADRTGSIGRVAVTMIVSVAALGVAVELSGSPPLNIARLVADLLVTALAYPLVARLLHRNELA